MKIKEACSFSKFSSTDTEGGASCFPGSESGGSYPWCRTPQPVPSGGSRQSRSSALTEFVRGIYHITGDDPWLVGHDSSAVLRTWLSRRLPASHLASLRPRHPIFWPLIYLSLQCCRVNTFVLSLARTPDGLKNTCAIGHRNSHPPPRPPTPSAALPGPRPEPLVEALTQRPWRLSCPVSASPADPQPFLTEETEVHGHLAQDEH